MIIRAKYEFQGEEVVRDFEIRDDNTIDIGVAIIPAKELKMWLERFGAKDVVILYTLREDRKERIEEEVMEIYKIATYCYPSEKKYLCDKLEEAVQKLRKIINIEEKEEVEE